MILILFSRIQKFNLFTDILTDYGDKTAFWLSKITHQAGSP